MLNLPNETTIAIDTETTGLFTYKGDRPYIISWCTLTGNKGYVRFDVDKKTREVLYDAEKLKELKAWFSEKREWIFHNAKFDLFMLQSIGITVNGIIQDSMLLSHTIWNLKSLKLKELAKQLCDYPEDDVKVLKEITIKERRKQKADGLPIADSVEADYFLSGEEVERYAMNDAERTMLLWLCLQKIVTIELYELYKIEMEMLFVVMKMEQRGVILNEPEIERLTTEAEEKLRVILYDLHNYGITPEIIRSGKQLSQVLFGDLGLTTEYSKPNSNGYSTDAETMLKLCDVHAAPRLILAYKAWSGVKDRFLANYNELATLDNLTNGEYRVLHPQFHVVGTVTGRFSSSNPNLQNVPSGESKSAEPIALRSVFRPRPGYVWYSFDYSQMEVRMFAYLSNDKILNKLIDQDVDLHTAIANTAYGGKDNPSAIRAAINTLALDRPEALQKEIIEFRENRQWKPLVTGERLTAEWHKRATTFVTKWLSEFDWDIVAAEKSIGIKTTRARAKNVMFAKCYGGGVSAICKLLRCEYLEAEQFIEDFDRAFPGITAYIAKLARYADIAGYIENAYNRRSYVELGKAYKAVNYMVQGSCADMMKQKMIAVAKYLTDNRFDAHLILTIHDEIVIEVNKRQASVNKLIKPIIRIMEDCSDIFPGKIFKVDCERMSKDWYNKETVCLQY